MIRVFDGRDAWALAASFHQSFDAGNVLVLPCDKPPKFWFWPTECRYCEIVWPGGSVEAIRELAQELLNAGALAVYSFPNGELTIYTPPPLRG